MCFQRDFKIDQSPSVWTHQELVKLPGSRWCQIIGVFNLHPVETRFFVIGVHSKGIGELDTHVVSWIRLQWWGDRIFFIHPNNGSFVLPRKRRCIQKIDRELYYSERESEIFLWSSSLINMNFKLDSLWIQWKWCRFYFRFRSRFTINEPLMVTWRTATKIKEINSLLRSFLLSVNQP